MTEINKMATGQISIHALLAESDLFVAANVAVVPLISIHALLAESDTIFAVRPYDAPIFLSTLSLRRATLVPHEQKCRDGFLSTLSLRRATVDEGAHHQLAPISIHALLAESDLPSIATYQVA